MPDLYVNEGELQTLSATLGERVQQMGAIIDTIPQTQNFLASAWEGEAARAAFNRMQIDEEELRYMADVLAKAQQLLDEAIQTYEETEQSVSSLWSL
ncbi:MAG: WXG100 family type VII secretion target [Isoptericola variabilis]|nr:WXG100 family type VII secretion target [Isoptericola variabilis]